MKESYSGLSLDALTKVARRCSERLHAGHVVALLGDVGSGKTTFCREIIQALSTDSFLGSPTYGIIHEYCCSGFTLYHIDLYRVETLMEVHGLGLFDVLVGNLVLMEWPQLVEQAIRFDVRIRLKPSSSLSAVRRDVEIEWLDDALSN